METDCVASMNLSESKIREAALDKTMRQKASLTDRIGTVSFIWTNCGKLCAPESALLRFSTDPRTKSNEKTERNKNYIWKKLNDQHENVFIRKKRQPQGREVN